MKQYRQLIERYSNALLYIQHFHYTNIIWTLFTSKLQKREGGVIFERCSFSRVDDT